MKTIFNLARKNIEIINYLIVGVVTMAITLIMFYILTEIVLDPSDMFELQIANILSWILAVSFSYVANRKYVFKSTSNNIFGEMTKFFLSRCFSLMIDMLLMFVLVFILMINDQISKIFVQIIITILNYVISKCFAFNKGVDS